ncbi:MAG TPA: hypothetical protein VGH54_15685 [Mycobacterium sp.]|uniref:hypothetical protein n=1 Tax=Mycobacterium sp. TaxID=1785 RepID=UPI002F427D37
MTTADLQPDVEDVLQIEDPAGVEPTVKVEQHGPWRTQALPRKAGSTKTVPVTTTPFRLLRPNARRASVYVISDAAFYFAYTGAAASIDTSVTTPPQTMAQWPPNVPLPVNAADVSVWVAAKTGTAYVSAVVEYWATGEGVE